MVLFSYTKIPLARRTTKRALPTPGLAGLTGTGRRKEQICSNGSKTSSVTHTPKKQTNGKGEIGNVGAAINNAAECIHMFLTERQSSEKLMSALYLNRADRIWILRFVSDIFPKKKAPYFAEKRGFGTFYSGPPEGIRTPVLQNRNLLRYPTAPPAEIFFLFCV